MKRLKDYAKDQSIKYRAAWNRYKAGKITGADEFGNILIDENQNKPPYTVCYCRVSSSQNKNNLEKPAQRLVSYCAAKAYKVE